MSSQTGRVPLHWACMSGHTATAELLVSLGADMTARDDVRSRRAISECLRLQLGFEEGGMRSAFVVGVQGPVGSGIHVRLGQ